MGLYAISIGSLQCHNTTSGSGDNAQILVFDSFSAENDCENSAKSSPGMMWSARTLGKGCAGCDGDDENGDANGLGRTVCASTAWSLESNNAIPVLTAGHHFQKALETAGGRRRWAWWPAINQVQRSWIKLRTPLKRSVSLAGRPAVG
jgi:hypothetical protein